MSLEDDWADIRPELLAEPILIRPDHLQDEAKTPGGLIVPAATWAAGLRVLTDPGIPPGTVYAVGEPEFVGRMPIRSELRVQPADAPGRGAALGWMVHEVTDEEIAERDSAENLHRLREEREGSVAQESGRVVWTSLPVLEDLWGRSWNAGAANFLRSLRPSSVRVIRHMEGQTADSAPWRVTVQLDEGNTHVLRISQEVEVAGVGFRNGQDARNFYDNNQDQLMQGQPSMIINPRALRLLNDPPPDDRYVSPRRELHERPSSRRERQQENDRAQFDRAEAAQAQARQELPGAIEAAIQLRAGELYEAAELAAIRGRQSEPPMREAVDDDAFTSLLD